jgi:serine protease Do
LLAHDRRLDLAALRIDARVLPAAERGDSRALHSGAWVVALGHPWGMRGAATAGTVIGAGPDWPRTPWGGQEWILVRLHLRPGYSGGPLVEAQGRIVGINTMVTGPELGAAVPVHVVEAFLERSVPMEFALV